MSITPEQASCKDANISEIKDLELQIAHVLELDGKLNRGDLVSSSGVIYELKDCALLMAQIIRHQQEQLRVAREALEAINGEQSCGNFNARQALSLIGDKA